MASITRHIVQAFQHTEAGLAPCSPQQATSSDVAQMLAARISQEKAGVLAFTWIGDPYLCEEGRHILIAKYGAVPESLLERMGLS